MSGRTTAAAMTRPELEAHCAALEREVRRYRWLARAQLVEAAKDLRTDPMHGTAPGERQVTDPFQAAVATVADEAPLPVPRASK